MGMQRNLFGLLDAAAESPHRNAPALTFDGISRSPVEIRSRSLRLANGLSRLGVGKGDAVAVLLGNGHQWPETLFALSALGAVCVPVNVLLTGPEIAHLCNDAGVKALVVDRYGARASEADIGVDLVVQVGGEAVVEGATVERYESLVEDSPADQPGSGPDLADPLVYYYSSGTTGRPKAAIHTHNSVLWNSFPHELDLELTAGTTYLIMPSFSWAAGFHNFVLTLLRIGGRSVIMPTGGNTIERVLEVIEREGITRLMLVPSLLRQLLADDACLARARETKLEDVDTGTEPVPLAMIETAIAELPNVALHSGWGLSEGPTIATHTRTPEEWAGKLATVGTAMSHTQLAVQDGEGRIERAGEGELLIRSPATMDAYHNQPELTTEVFADGWLHTGDLGRIDDAGFVQIIGRKKDMIISGGLNVYPAEIEQVIARIPGVREAAVVGVEDAKFGEAPIAVVVGSSAVSEDLVSAECKGELAGYKRPRRVILREEPLPRNQNGKILKRELLPWVEQWIERSDDWPRSADP
jgi:fatty-acyl-CoA synthase